MPGEQTSLSKLLSFLLRHRPQAVGLRLSAEGWVSVDELISALAAHGHTVDRATLERIVAESDKQRFAFSSDGRLMRANQGHSVSIDLGLTPEQPPDVLFHGTVARYLAAIRAQGLLKGKRHHVHLSATIEVARSVGGRRGVPTVLRVDAAAMARDGYLFYRSQNGVWLTEHVPPQFLVIPTQAG